MTTLIILIALIAIGYYLTTKWKYELLGISMCVIFGIWLLIHIISWSLVSYDYELFVEKRNSFEQTLIYARKNGNQYETAAIVREISEWNEKLATSKYNNKTLFLGQYIDDRIELLEPIK